MKRLNTKQKRLIKEEYRTHWFYVHFATAAKEMERRLDQLRLSPEELFVESVMQLDSFLQDPEAYIEVVARSLWDEYYCQLREESPAQTARHELELGASELCYIVNYLLCSLTGKPMTASAAAYLTESLMYHPDAFDEVTQCFQPKLWTSKQDTFLSALQQYAEAGERMSDAITKRLEDCMSADVYEAADVDAANDTFTLRQTVILMQELLNISLDAGDNNIAKLSRFIHRVTGRKTESIRSAINKLKASKKTPQKELKQIAAAISQFNPQLAKDILARSD